MIALAYSIRRNICDSCGATTQCLIVEDDNGRNEFKMCEGCVEMEFQTEKNLRAERFVKRGKV